MLQHYATQLNSVEVNYTFRHLPSAATIDAWLAQTGRDFRFSFKAPQRITHIKRLKECSDALSAFYSALLPVIRAGTHGVVLFQLPPNLKADTARLATFLNEAAPEKKGLLCASPLNSVTHRGSQTRSSLCFGSIKPPFAWPRATSLQTPDVVTAPFCCYRLRKSDYGPTDLKQIEEAADRKGTLGRCFRVHQARGLPQGRAASGRLLTNLRAR